MIYYQKGKTLEHIMHKLSNANTRQSFRNKEKLIKYYYYLLVFAVTIAATIFVLNPLIKVKILSSSNKLLLSIIKNTV